MNSNNWIYWVAPLIILIVAIAPKKPEGVKTYDEMIKEQITALKQQTRSSSLDSSVYSSKSIISSHATSENRFVTLLKFMVGTVFVPLSMYLTLRIQSVSSTGKFFCHGNEMFPRFGCLGMIIVLITTPLAGYGAIMLVIEWIL